MPRPRCNQHRSTVATRGLTTEPVAADVYIILQRDNFRHHSIGHEPRPICECDCTRRRRRLRKGRPVLRALLGVLCCLTVICVTRTHATAYLDDGEPHPDDRMQLVFSQGELRGNRVQFRMCTVEVGRLRGLLCVCYNAIDAIDVRACVYIVSSVY